MLAAVRRANNDSRAIATDGRCDLAIDTRDSAECCVEPASALVRPVNAAVGRSQNTIQCIGERPTVCIHPASVDHHILRLWSSGRVIPPDDAPFCAPGKKAGTAYHSAYTGIRE